MTDDKQAILNIYADYVAAFQTLDPRAVLPWYHLPCLLQSARGLLVLATAADLEALFAPMMADLKARSYARTELTALQVKQLNARGALLTIRGVRIATSGAELERIGASYLLHKAAGAWQFALLAVQDADVEVKLEQST